MSSISAITIKQDLKLLWKKICELESGADLAISTLDSPTIVFTGDGSPSDPLTATATGAAVDSFYVADGSLVSDRTVSGGNFSLFIKDLDSFSVTNIPTGSITLDSPDNILSMNGSNAHLIGLWSVGSVGFTPTAYLHVGAGSATIPAIKLTQGPNLTVIQNGVFEYTSGGLTFAHNGVRYDVLAAAAPANPTALVGTAAVNGTATTYLRSDAAPAIDQAMTPTWAGKHIWQAGSVFEGVSGATTPTLQLNSSIPQLDFLIPGQGVDLKRWNISTTVAGFTITGLNDAGTTVTKAYNIDRGVNSITSHTWYLAGSIQTMQAIGGSVSIGTAAPAASAILDLQSTVKGLLVPRMTTAQKNAIAAPVAGLVVYDTTSNTLDFRDTTTWQSLPANVKTLTVTNSTAAVTVLTSADSGELFSNTGAAVNTQFNLPAATVGLHYYFSAVTLPAASKVIIKANGTDVITTGTGDSTAGGTATSSNKGDGVHLYCNVAGHWQTLDDQSGYWIAA